MRTLSSRCAGLVQGLSTNSFNSNLRKRSGLAAIAWSLLAVAAPHMTHLDHRVFADGPADNKVENIRPIPPLGIEVPAEVREGIVQALVPLQQAVGQLRNDKNAIAQKYLPDVEIFSRAVEIALNENGFFEPADFDRAKELIAEGLRRSEVLLKNDLLRNATPQTEKGLIYWWWPENGLTVLGFRSQFDGSAQP